VRERKRVVAAVALAFAIAALALAAGLLARGGGGGGGEETPPPAEPVAATASFEPPAVLFGDTLGAWVDVLVDRTAIDPDRVSVTWDPAPWTSVRPPRRVQESAGATAHVRTAFLLRCLARACVPARDTEQVELAPAQVAYPAPGGAAGRLEVRWPVLVVHSRLTGLDASRRDALSAPWRADLLTPPAVSYRVAPGLAIALLGTAGALLTALAALLAYRARPRRERAPEPEPEPAPPLPPLELALALLSGPASADGSEERRRALELVAEASERLGEEELAGAARALAWSADAPPRDEARALAARLRSRLERGDGARA